MIENRMCIAGKWVESVSGESREIINPANSEVIANVTEGAAEDAKKAIAAARKTFDETDWPNLPGLERGNIVHRLGELVSREAEELARLESLDTGKTLEESRWDMEDIAGIFKYYAGLADKDNGEIIDSPIAESSSQVVREAVGVCGQISPWNYPLLQASWKLAPALVAGCTMVVKPSEITPLTTIRITELAQEAGVPEGVINIVLGPGNTVGAALSESPEVDMISFTGGIETGKRIIRAASGNIKKIALELGGKNPHIIFADAQFDNAVDAVLNGVFYHAGQICSAGARLMIEDSIHDRFVEAVKARIEKIKLGDAFDSETQMGPLISAEHRKKVESYVEIAKQEGAQCISGGSRPKDKQFESGFFYLPTLLTSCDDEMRIVREEVFGPVISVERFKNEDEAVRRANNTIYGLSAGFWTQDADRAHRVSKALRFGTVWVNDFNVYFTQAPWGGFKQSGMGRELGKYGLEEYTELKHIFQNHNPKAQNWFGT